MTGNTQIQESVGDSHVTPWALAVNEQRQGGRCEEINEAGESEEGHRRRSSILGSARWEPNCESCALTRLAGNLDRTVVALDDLAGKI